MVSRPICQLYLTSCPRNLISFLQYDTFTFTQHYYLNWYYCLLKCEYTTIRTTKFIIRRQVAPHYLRNFYLALEITSKTLASSLTFITR